MTKFPSLGRQDVVAGLSVASILMPEAIAYATIAHLSIQHAVTALLAGLLCYACLGGSQYAVVSPTSSAAALLAAAVLSLRPLDATLAMNSGFALVILTGTGLLILAKAGLGRLSAFVSRPVLHGFSFALAITIIAKQLPIITGINTNAANPLQIVIDLFRHVHEWSLFSSAIGFGALLLLTILKRWATIPGAFVVLILGIVLSHNISLANYHVALVNQVDIQAPIPNWPQLPIERWLRLSELACGLLVILVAESWGSIRSISLRHNQEVEPNRELFALGASNLVSGILQGMPVGAGFSASSASEQAGAQTKWAGISAALMVLLMVVFGQQWIALIPEPVVAAAVISALGHALNPKSLLSLWRMNRDQYLALAAIIAVLAFGVLHGMMIGVALSIAAAMRSFSQPLVKELAELGRTRDYVDYQNHPNALVHPHMLILRPEEPLFFGSVEGVLTEVQRCFSQAKEANMLILSLEESADFDSTAAENMIELADDLQRRGKTLLLARVKDPVRALLLLLAPVQFQDKLFWSVADAVAYAQNHIALQADP